MTMKSSHAITLVFGLVALATAGSVYAIGVESSGGADNYVPTPAWFRDEDTILPIHACLDVSPDFGISKSDLQKLVQDEWAIWLNYMNYKDIIRIQHDKDTNTDSDWYMITTVLQVEPNCVGDEDLKFYFGTSSPEVVAASSQFTQPLAFSQPTTPYGNHWRKGFIWVSAPEVYTDKIHEKRFPEWSVNGKTSDGLHDIIRHEFGHVLGCGHIDGTVMDATLGFYYGNAPQIEGYRPNQIDWKYQLDLAGGSKLQPKLFSDVMFSDALNGTTAGQNYVGVGYDIINPSIVRAIYKKITGRDVAGQVALSFSQIPQSQAGNASGQLVFRDSLGSVIINITSTHRVNSVTSNSHQIFRGQFNFPVDDGDSEFVASPLTGATYLGQLTLADGSQQEVIIGYNIGAGYTLSMVSGPFDGQQFFSGYPVGH